MAYALANGNFSNAANWNTGVVPGIGEIAYCNGKQITIDVDVHCLELTNRAGSGIAANGYYIAGTDRTITAKLTNGQTIASNHLLQLPQPAVQITINGNIDTVSTYNASDSSVIFITGVGAFLDVNGNVDCSAMAVNADYGIIANAANVTITVVGNVKPASGASSSYGIYLNSTGQVCNVVGDVYGGIANSIATVGIRSASNGNTINIVGNCYAKQGSCVYVNSGCIVNITGDGFFTTSGNSVGIFQLASAGTTFNHTGNVTGGSQAAYYITALSSVLNLYGNAIAGATYAVRVATTATNAQVYVQKAVGYQGSDLSTVVAVINETTSANVVVGEIEFGFTGQAPTNGCVKFKSTYNTKANVLLEDGVSRRVIAASGADDPDEADVRKDTLYSFGTKKGTLAVPPKPMVALGVPTDDGVGTLNPSVDASALAQDLFDVIKTSNDPLADRLRNVSTEESVAQIITAAL